MIEFGPQKRISKLLFKNLFSFSRYLPSKSGTGAGSSLDFFTRFPKIIIGKPSSVTSQVIKAPWSVQSAVTYVMAKQVETAKFDGFWKNLEEIMVHCAAYDCLMVVGRPKAFHSTNFKQITNEGRKP